MSTGFCLAATLQSSDSWYREVCGNICFKFVTVLLRLFGAVLSRNRPLQSNHTLRNGKTLQSVMSRSKKPGLPYENPPCTLRRRKENASRASPGSFLVSVLLVTLRRCGLNHFSVTVWTNPYSLPFVV